jgi:hypothetical protein
MLRCSIYGTSAMTSLETYNNKGIQHWLRLGLTAGAMHIACQAPPAACGAAVPDHPRPHHTAASVVAAPATGTCSTL